MQYNLQGTTAQLVERRNQLLANSDWLMLRHRDQIDAGLETTLSLAQYEEVLTYRQALRDWDRVSPLPAAPSFL